MNAMRICSVCSKPLAANAPQGLCPECLLKAGLGTGVDIGPDRQSQAESGKVPFVAPTPEELAKLFPQLEIMGFIGQGGMGAVYKARQKALDRVVALKILPPGIGKDPAFAKRFTREARAMAKLNHPGIVTLYEFGQADGLFFFLMEFVDGVNLRHLLEAGRLSPREALAIVPQICDALQCAHDQGIVHRDIKPENILLDRQGRVKVADFGLAKLVGTDALAHPMGEGGAAAPGEGTLPSVVLTEAGKVMGTPQYMAPEQVSHPAEVDHRADIYSLGVVFYQMLTGELPGQRIEPPSHTIRVDVRLDEVVLRALEKEPERRYQQVSQMKTAVESIASTQPAVPSRIGDSTAAPRLSRTAVAGAAMASLSFILPGLLYLVMQASIPDAAAARPLLWPSVILAGLLACATMMVGALGVTQIRRSAGRVYGLGLALFDALLFPLLLLDGLIFDFWYALGQVVEESRGGFGGPAFRATVTFAVFTLTVVTSAVVDFLITRRAWRAVKKPLGGIVPAAVPPKAEPPPKGGLWLLAYAGLTLACLSGVLGAIAWVLMPNPPQALVWSILVAAVAGTVLVMPVRKTRPGRNGIIIGCLNVAVWLIIAAASEFIQGFFAPALPAPAQGSSFGPVIERVVNDWALHWDGFIDFDSGQLLDSREDFSTDDPKELLSSKKRAAAGLEFNADDLGKVLDWTKRTGADAMFLSPQSADTMGLRGLDMAVIETNALAWDGCAPGAIITALRGKSHLVEWKLMPMLSPRVGLPGTYLFKTREGGAGLLQILGFTENQRGVKIRYKLVQRSEGAGKQSVQIEPIEKASSVQHSIPIVTAKPGQYSVTLSNGAKLEVVAIARNPRNTNVWWRPDGVVLAEPPADELRFTGALQTGETAEDEFAFFTRTTGPSGDPYPGLWPSYVPPQPHERPDVSVALLKDKRYVSHAPLLWFGQPPEKLTYRFGLAAGPWAPVASFDGSSTNLQPGEGPVEFTPPQAEGGDTVLRFRHTVDRNRFSLRLVAQLPSGGRAEVGLWDGYSTNGMNEARAVIHDVSPSQVKMYRVLKTPWLWGEIADIALRPLSIPPAHGPVSNAVPFQPTASTRVRTKPPSGFGPIIERVVNSDGATENILIDFDSGRLLFPPPELDRKDRAALEAWLRKEGVDALADAGDTVRGFVGFDMIARPVAAPQWDYVTGPAVADNEFLTLGKPGSPVFLSAKGQLPETFLIKTREGAMGILQISGFTDNPRGVKIRYKLVQRGEGAGKQSAQIESIEKASSAQPLAGGGAMTFGPEGKGLRAAVELISSNGVFALGEPIEVLFHIRNTSSTSIYVAGGSWRQDDTQYITIEDQQGRQIPVHHIFYTVRTQIQRNLLLPGESAVFHSSGLAFLAKDADGKQVTQPVGNYVKVTPGRYTVRYRLHFPDLEQRGPEPSDWQGDLDTAPVTVEVTAANESAAAPGFGPMVERVLPFSAPCRMQYFQFHTGNVLAIGDGPDDKTDHAEDYRRAEETGGLDVSVIGGKDGLQLAGEGCIFTHDKSPNWDTMTAEAAVRTLRRESWLNGVVEVKQKDFPATYLFKTARGECGLLQILGVMDDPLGMKIRYKLVQRGEGAGKQSL